MTICHKRCLERGNNREEITVSHKQCLDSQLFPLQRVVSRLTVISSPESGVTGDKMSKSTMILIINHEFTAFISNIAWNLTAKFLLLLGVLTVKIYSIK